MIELSVRLVLTDTGDRFVEVRAGDQVLVLAPDEVDALRARLDALDRAVERWTEAA